MAKLNLSTLMVNLTKAILFREVKKAMGFIHIKIVAFTKVDFLMIVDKVQEKFILQTDRSLKENFTKINL